MGGTKIKKFHNGEGEDYSRAMPVMHVLPIICFQTEIGKNIKGQEIENG